ncbi:GntR family transcriptional regulator [Pseudonocardia eucalypti]|uniref:GntR family transcriptional regulator n=1 Tax=Pseudonocardia eucalypti TaxID=648755 RepID=A0ABP9QPA1_9PSEU|nr:phosphonate utilization transcriptional regulator [Pseudonocardia eucalypti]
MDALQLVQTNSLAALVQREITELILTGEIGAGEWLNESALSERFGVSRAPVREAFRSLAELGLVRQLKNRGVFVREVTEEEADQIYELREVLDELIARKAAANATPEHLAALEGLLDDMDRAADAGDLVAYYPLNLRFHDQLAVYAANPKLTELYRRLMNELHLFRLRGLSGRGAMPTSRDEHRAILDAIRAGDPDAAGRLAREHVNASRRRRVSGPASPAGGPPPR